MTDHIEVVREALAKTQHRYFDVVGPGLFQLTDQDGFCVEDADDDAIAAAMSRNLPALMEETA